MTNTKSSIMPTEANRNAILLTAMFFEEQAEKRNSVLNHLNDKIPDDGHVPACVLAWVARFAGQPVGHSQAIIQNSIDLRRFFDEMDGLLREDHPCPAHMRWRDDTEMAAIALRRYLRRYFGEE